MLFRTEIAQQNWPFNLDHSQPVIHLGSCFSQHISARLKQRLFRVAPNPFGTSYNPISLANQVEKLVSDNCYTKADLLLNNDLFFSCDHYTAFSHPDADLALQQINEALDQNRQLLNAQNQPGLLLITLGTAHAWKHIAYDRVVNNCHKLPGQQFDRIFVEPDEIVHRLEASLASLQQKAPLWKVLISVSPVRHLRDGISENQRSKSALILAANRLADQLNFVHYFPAYEIMMDDLRDYRFYEADLIHPNTQAIEYIWDYFSAGLFTEKTRNINKRVLGLSRFFGHQPKHNQSVQHQHQYRAQIKKLNNIKSEYPELNWQHFDTQKQHNV